MSPEPDLGELLANDASRICFRWPEMAVFRVSVKVAEISYPSTFSVVEFLGIALPPQRNEKQQPTKFPVSRGETKEGGTDEGAVLLPCSTLGQLGPVDKVGYFKIAAKKMTWKPRKEPLQEWDTSICLT